MNLINVLRTIPQKYGMKIFSYGDDMPLELILNILNTLLYYCHIILYERHGGADAMLCIN